ncbi:MAG TPA: DUF4398 domain-containing protein [Steroidobacteraceae bacterium]|jgi:hypothetical protein|nr:DUF4398 domain-containing protein [Steroidobacteraceae bacterium]
MNVFQTHHILRLHAAAGIAGVLALAACASAPPAPTASLQAAQQAIVTAEQANAGRYASVELGEARAELTSANAAVTDQHMVMADRLANESLTEAQLAYARTAYVKAQAINDDMTRSNGALIEEMQRNSGDKQ